MQLLEKTIDIILAVLFLLLSVDNKHKIIRFFYKTLKGLRG